MASKEIKFKIKLDIDGQEHITTAITSAKNLKNAIEGTKDKTDALHSSVYKLNQAFTVWSNIKSSFEGLDNALSALASSYRNVEVANKRLATVMEERMSATAADISTVQKAIKAQTQLGIIGGSVQKAGAQQVATFLTQKEALLTLIPAMNDLIAQQKGLNASEQDAQAIGNLFGKVMQGQTSALKRVGITFTEAQEQVLKMGTEQERAAMLAEVVTANVGHMNAALGNTAAGSMKQFSNWLAGIKVKMGEFANYIQPTLSMVTSFAMLAASAQGAFLAISNVGKAIGVTKALAISVRFLRFEWVAIKSALQAFILVVRVSRAQNISLAASFKLVAAASTTAKVAMRGFMSATVVGAALVAVGFAIEKLIGYFDKSTDAVQGNTQALEDNASALTQADRIKKAVSEVQGNASSHYADEISKIKSLTSVIHDSNAKYADRLKAIRNLQSIIPGYHAQIQKDGTIFERNAAAVDKYIRKLEDLAMAEAAFDKIKDIGKQIVTLRIKQQQYKKQAQDIDNTIKSENGGKGADQLNNPLNRFHFPTQDAAPTDAVNQNGTINFNYLRDKANAQVQSRQHQERLSSQLNAHTIATGQVADLGAQIDEKNEEIQAILGILTPTQRSAYDTIAANGGYPKGGGAPSLVTPGKGGHTTGTHTTGGAATTQDNEPQEGSLKYYDDKISKLRQEAQATSDLTQAQNLLAQAAQLEAKRKDLAIHLGLEAPDKTEVRDTMDVLQELLHNAEKDYEQADTTETKEFALNRINIWKNQIEALQAQRIVLQLEVDPEGAKQSIQSLRRTKYSEAQSKANTVQSDLADGLIDQKEANRQIQQINHDLKAQIGKGFKPITLQVDTQEAEYGIKHFTTQSRKAWSSITSGVLGTLGFALYLMCGFFELLCFDSILR